MERIMNISKILVGIDASAEARAAQHHALEMARRTNAELILAHACPRPEVSPRSLDSTAVFRNLVIPEITSLELARALDHQPGPEEHGVKVSKLFIARPPDPGLVHAASQHHVDVIVVGSHGRGGIMRALFGSLAERTVRLADTTVLVARGPVPPGGYRRILAPTDFSESAEQALQLALTLADPGATIEIIHCWTSPAGTLPVPVPVGTTAAGVAAPLVPPVAGNDPCLPAEDLVDVAMSEGQRLLAAYGHGSVALEFELITDGDRPGHTILDRLETGSYDLCAMGSHGRRGLRRLLLGSVAESTVRSAPCSVLVSHTARRAD
jgi:nucleotide-binding universal stress UspA family protein